MQGHYPAAFEREMGCTEQELRTWLPGACGQHPIQWSTQRADIEIDAGRATVVWHTLEPRRIALLAVPRLHVCFEARGVDEVAWQRFMRHFDLYTQRGGG